MNVDYIDFKTVSLTSKLDTSIGAELQLTQTGKVSVKLPEEWSGFAFLYLNIVIHDPEDKYFVFGNALCSRAKKSELAFFFCKNQYFTEFFHCFLLTALCGL